jgi:hypothetical protein
MPVLVVARLLAEPRAVATATTRSDRARASSRLVLRLSFRDTVRVLPPFTRTTLRARVFPRRRRRRFTLHRLTARGQVSLNLAIPRRDARTSSGPTLGPPQPGGGTSPRGHARPAFVSVQSGPQVTPALVTMQVGSPGQINPALVRKQERPSGAGVGAAGGAGAGAAGDSGAGAAGSSGGASGAGAEGGFPLRLSFDEPGPGPRRR